MLEDLQAARKRWGGDNDIIDRWLQERQELLESFCALSEQPGADNTPQRLQRTCQVLVDYVSAGHFEIYQKLLEEGREQAGKEGLKRARELYQGIDATTEDILDFNDKYQETDDLETLGADLSRLGEILATRFEAEDRMIEILHGTRPGD